MYKLKEEKQKKENLGIALYLLGIVTAIIAAIFIAG